VQPFLIIHVFDEIRDSSVDVSQCMIFPEIELLGFRVCMNDSAKALSYGLPFRAGYPVQ
jgi:hypothetical protein